MRDVHDDEAIQGPHGPHRENPGDHGAPVVGDQQAAAGAVGVEQGRRIGDEVVEPIGADRARPAAVAVTAQVGRDGMPAHRRKRFELVTPGEAALGKTVQAQRDVRPGAGLVHREGQAVGVEGPRGDRHCRFALEPSVEDDATIM